MEEQNTDMDIDMLDTQDTTAVTDAELAALEQELEQHNGPSHTPPDNVESKATEHSPRPQSSESGASTLRPEAILLQGVDEMSTREIRVYCKDLPLDKIEWIDDTSCVLVFANEEVAKEAAEALLVGGAQEPLSSTVLCKSQPFTDVSAETMNDNLRIRMATTSDVKEKGARDRSRYYLLHGEGSHDFDEYEKAKARAANKRGDILSRLGERREREPPRMRSESPAGSVLDRLGKRDESRPSRRSNDRRSTHRRRSLSPPARSPPTDRQGDDDPPRELPESLKGRLGPRRS